jgi:hypothetical protein
MCKTHRESQSQSSQHVVSRAAAMVWTCTSSVIVHVPSPKASSDSEGHAESDGY